MHTSIFYLENYRSIFRKCVHIDWTASRRIQDGIRNNIVNCFLYQHFVCDDLQGGRNILVAALFVITRGFPLPVFQWFLELFQKMESFHRAYYAWQCSPPATHPGGMAEEAVLRWPEQPLGNAPKPVDKISFWNRTLSAADPAAQTLFLHRRLRHTVKVIIMAGIPLEHGMMFRPSVPRSPIE